MDKEVDMYDKKGNVKIIKFQVSNGYAISINLDLVI